VIFWFFARRRRRKSGRRDANGIFGWVLAVFELFRAVFVGLRLGGCGICRLNEYRDGFFVDKRRSPGDN